MSTAGTPDAEYKVTYIEKENDRLIESVKHVRQNALALVAAVLLITSAMLNVDKPLITGLKKNQYDGSIQLRWLGNPLTPEREVAIQHLTLIWNLTSFVAILGEIFTIIFTVLILLRSGKYTPILNKNNYESMTAIGYSDLLIKQNTQLTKFNKSYRLYLIMAASSALMTVLGCSLITLLWLLFGDPM
jgi:hypothetical protein